MELVRPDFFGYNTPAARKGSFFKMSPEIVNHSGRGVENLAAINEEAKPESLHFIKERIPLGDINTLLQPRRTFGEIESLADNIATHGLLYPLLIGKHSRESAKRYLEAINRLWETDYKIEDLNGVIEGDKEVFYILIDGERRLRACWLLQKEGCRVCQEEYGPGDCYERHFDDQRVDANLYENITPLEAFSLQASANIHERVPPEEASWFYYYLFNLKLRAHPDYPKTRFAREMGKSWSVIDDAVRYCELPNTIQELTIKRGKKRRLLYGVAVALSYLQQEGMSEENLMRWATLAIAGNHKVADFRKMVFDYIEQMRQIKAGQTMFDIFTEEKEKEMRKLGIRQAVRREWAIGLWGFLRYWEYVFGLFSKGMLGREDSPFSESGTVRLFRKSVEEQKKLLPFLRSFLPQKVYREAQETLQEAEEITFLLEAQWEVRKRGTPFIFLPKGDSLVN